MNFDFNSAAHRLETAADNQDGFSAAKVLKEAGQCHVTKLMNTYDNQLFAPSLVLTDLGESSNGGEYMSLEWVIHDLQIKIVPLATKVDVPPCPETDK